MYNLLFYLVLLVVSNNLCAAHKINLNKKQTENVFFGDGLDKIEIDGFTPPPLVKGDDAQEILAECRAKEVNLDDSVLAKFKIEVPDKYRIQEKTLEENLVDGFNEKRVINFKKKVNFEQKEEDDDEKKKNTASSKSPRKKNNPDKRVNFDKKEEVGDEKKKDNALSKSPRKKDNPEKLTNIDKKAEDRDEKKKNKASKDSPRVFHIGSRPNSQKKIEVFNKRDKNLQNNSNEKIEVSNIIDTTVENSIKIIECFSVDDIVRTTSESLEEREQEREEQERKEQKIREGKKES